MLARYKRGAYKRIVVVHDNTFVLSLQKTTNLGEELIRHPHHPGTSRAQGRGNDDDLHPRAQPAGTGHQEHGGPNAGVPETTLHLYSSILILPHPFSSRRRRNKCWSLRLHASQLVQLVFVEFELAEFP